MLILVGTVPTAYALNRAMPVARTAEFVALAQATEHSLQAAGGGVAFANPREALSAFVRTRQASPEVVAALAAVAGQIGEQVHADGSLRRLPAAAVANVRNDM